MQLWIAVHLPRLSLEVFFPRHSSAITCAVLEQERVLSMSPAAWNAGVRIGMRRGGVTMVAPETTVLDRDLEREREGLAAVGLALLQYTPQVAAAEESVLLMNVGASLTLFGGPRALCRRVAADMRALGYTASIGTAPTARGAWLLARHGGSPARTLKMLTLQRRLDQLPALLVPATRRFAEWFEGIGCSTVSDLRKLPRPGVQRRCGRALLDVLDAAFGLAPEAHDWIEPPETFRVQVEIFDRIEKADELLVGAHRLILQLIGWLCSRHLAVQKIVLEMLHERGRAARPPSRLEIAVAEPVWRDEHLLRLLKEHLARQVLDAPVIGLVLEAADFTPLALPSESLFPEPGKTEGDRQQLLEVLTARLGADNVLKPRPKADYRPEVVNAWVPASTPVRNAELQAELPPQPALVPRPTWILEKPIQLLLRDERPFYGSPLKIVSKPERVEAGWWTTPACRDYFIAEGTDHTLYWIFRDRTAGDTQAPEPRWFLHGFFG